MRELATPVVLVMMAFAGCGKDGKPPTTPPPTAACCAPVGTCTVTAEVACLSPNTWQAPGRTAHRTRV